MASAFSIGEAVAGTIASENPWRYRRDEYSQDAATMKNTTEAANKMLTTFHVRSKILPPVIVPVSPPHTAGRAILIAPPAPPTKVLESLSRSLLEIVLSAADSRAARPTHSLLRRRRLAQPRL